MLVTAFCAQGIQSSERLVHEEDKLTILYDDIWHHQMITWPAYATHVGYPGQNGFWPDPSLEANLKYSKKRKEFFKEIKYHRYEKT
jgi:hypothetical protein